ncbi:hypothetical protein GCM10009030_35400 [Haloarcula pellucida]|uniref:Uncharacterized protein n=1 Tax=Haloarcula pellucida TaxID=1427151 RepID=A0A830GRT8_9EURY|nr:hypothetical protein GCM10009030_35400 [Halomicroarcula pellucida]
MHRRPVVSRRFVWFSVGKPAATVLSQLMPTTAAQFRRDVDCGPTYPTYRDGSREAVQTWVNDGTGRRGRDEWGGE